MDTIPEGKVKIISIELSYKLYERFRYKTTAEGYSMQKALQLLVDQYVNNQISTKGDGK